MECRTPGNPTVCPKAFACYQQKYQWPLVTESPNNRRNPFRKGPILQKDFPCHDVIIDKDVSRGVQVAKTVKNHLGRIEYQHDEVIKWKHFPRYRPFVRGIDFPSQRPVTRNFDAFIDLRLNKRLSKQAWGWCMETPSRSLWRHCNDTSSHQYSIFQYEDQRSWGRLVFIMEIPLLVGRYLYTESGPGLISTISNTRK